MHIDAITADFVVSFVAVIMTLLLIFPMIDVLVGWMARRSLPQESTSRDKDAKGYEEI